MLESDSSIKADDRVIDDFSLHGVAIVQELDSMHTRAKRILEEDSGRGFRSITDSGTIPDVIFWKLLKIVAFDSLRGEGSEKEARLEAP